MYCVCPHCRTDHPVKVTAERETVGEYVQTKCRICGTEFLVRKQKASCSYCGQEISIAAEVIELEKARLIYENQPDTIRDEIGK